MAASQQDGHLSVIQWLRAKSGLQAIQHQPSPYRGMAGQMNSSCIGRLIGSVATTVPILCFGIPQHSPITKNKFTVVMRSRLRTALNEEIETICPVQLTRRSHVTRGLAHGIDGIEVDTGVQKKSKT
jgi:hypothetical protein